VAVFRVAIFGFVLFLKIIVFEWPSEAITGFAAVTRPKKTKKRNWTAFRPLFGLVLLLFWGGTGVRGELSDSQYYQYVTKKCCENLSSGVSHRRM
jgi:hypothetical protein